MASTTNATAVLYGTAWSDDTLLAVEHAKNLEYEERTGIKRHFEYDWRTLDVINPKYKKFVEHCELPAFSRLDRMAGRIRRLVNRGISQTVSALLSQAA